jgi:hypothetical protein
MTSLPAILVLASMVCGPIHITNRTHHLWNADDEAAKNRAVERCVVHFPECPCLVRFIKLGEHDYHASCDTKYEEPE